MNRNCIATFCLLMVVFTTITGCIMRDLPRFQRNNDGPSTVDLPSTQFAPGECVDDNHHDLLTTAKPHTLDSDKKPEPRDLSLDEAISMSLHSSTVMKDLEGTVLKTPDLTRTIHDPAIFDTDPRFGEAAALSAFDAEITSRLNYEKNDRPINNSFFGGGTRIFTQDLLNFESQITKRAATGTEFTFRQTIDYDANNAPGNQFPSIYEAAVEGEFRHPLMRGGGVDFNRIAGPGSIPGLMNGVLVARLNTDVAIADFEIGLRDLVNDVENAYWDLYFAYRDLDAKIEVRDAALRNWREMKALLDSGEATKDQEAQAREQLYRFEEGVHEALVGRLLEGTRSDNGSQGGTFRGNSGVHVAERRLRLLLGLPINDGTLLRPTDEPTLAKVNFNWHEIGVEALSRRAELRKQRLRIRRRELELKASENFLLPRLDVLARYRFRGLGKDLNNPRRDPDPFDNAFQSLTTGNYQEWQVGLEFNMPFGFRNAHAGLRNAQLTLARDRTVLREQARLVVRNLTDAYDQVHLAYKTAKDAYNRRAAAIDFYNSILANFKNGRANAEELLDATRRLSEAKTHYHRKLIEYTLSIKNVNLEKGSLLDYNEIFLAENLWDQCQADECVECYNEELDYSFTEPVNEVKELPAEKQELPPKKIKEQAPQPIKSAQRVKRPETYPDSQSNRLFPQSNGPIRLPAAISSNAPIQKSSPDKSPKNLKKNGISTVGYQQPTSAGKKPALKRKKIERLPAIK